MNNTIELKTNIYIYVEQNKELNQKFENSVRSSIDSLESLQIGKRLLEKIAKSTHPILIKASTGEWRCMAVDGKSACTLGKGSASVISYSVELPSYLTITLATATRPTFINFAHELIHAYHNSKGKCADNLHTVDRMVWTDDEEYKTIMGPESKNPNRKTPKITENAILAACGLPERFSHFDLKWLESNPVNYERTKLLAQIYQEFCKKTNYEGQCHNPPPPLLNCTKKHLAPSKSLALLYNVSFPDLSLKFYFVGDPNSNSPPDDFVRQEIDLEDCPEELQFKNFYPEVKGEIKAMGLYRLSPLEKIALDNLTKSQQ